MGLAAIIPARLHSTRLPGKPLEKIQGREMILHVCDRARESNVFSVITVATDDPAIAQVVRSGGFECLKSDYPFASGSDRCAWVAEKLPATIEAIINLQGDEPLLNPSHIRIIADRLRAGEPFVSLATPIETDSEFHNPNVVKVVLNHTGHALYFSRSPIPFHRDGPREETPRLRHVGIYGFHRQFLLDFARLAPTPLSRAESLEQLRALEHGFPLRILIVHGVYPGVDTPEDLARAKANFLSCPWIIRKD